MADRDLSEFLPEPPGPTRLFWRFIKEHSYWYSRTIGVLALIAFSIHFGLNYFNRDADLDYLVDKAFILLGFTALLAGAIIREYKVSRKERYANVFEKIESISAGLRDLNTYLGTIGQSGLSDNQKIEQFQKLVRNALAAILDNISDVFSMVTGTVCRVALKCTFIEADEIYVYAVTRDTRSNRINGPRDKQRFEAREDKLRENEDFYSIFREEKQWYIEGNLPRKRNYQNSSFKVYGDPPDELPSVAHRFLRDYRWPLPYKATMVFPVRQRESEKLSFVPWGCIGFLAIDSAFARVFRPRFDGPLGASLANALFAPLSRYVELLDQVGTRGITHVKKAG